MNTSDYPGFISRSNMAFKYPQAAHLQNVHEAGNNHPMVFGTIVGPDGTIQPINLGTGFGSPPQRSVNGGDYISATDSATFQRRCASLKPRQMTNGAPYRYVQPPGSYVYGSMVNSPTRVMHCRGFSELAPANNQVPFSPHRQYALADDPHTYHDIDFAAATLQRQCRMAPTLEQVAEVMPSNGQQMSSPYGRLRQSATSYVFPPNSNSRYATIAPRMAPDGEVTALMESMTLKRSRQQMGHPEMMDQRFARQQSESEETVNSEEFDSQSEDHLPGQSPHSFDVAEEVESITDVNAKLITSLDESLLNDQTLTNKKTRMDQSDQSEPATSQVTEVIMESEVAFKPSSQANPTYAYREASFV